MEFFTVRVVKTVRPSWDPQHWKDAWQDYLVEAYTPRHAERLVWDLFEPCDDIADVYTVE